MKSTSTKFSTCRLCDGPTFKKFNLLVLGKHEVDYLECTSCNSLQTIEPFWLDETYSGRFPNLDFGAARRASRTCSIVLITNLILLKNKRSRLLDFGGGDGLACRLLRDCGFEAFTYDKFAINSYAHGYSGLPDQRYDIISAIEVLEHLPFPSVEIATIFSTRPEIVIISTGCYQGQGQDWNYLGPDQGGHVFFYSEQAMRVIASRFGYRFVSRDSTVVFYKRKTTLFHNLALRAALHPAGLLAGRIWLQLIKPRRPEIRGE